MMLIAYSVPLVFTFYVGFKIFFGLYNEPVVAARKLRTACFYGILIPALFAIVNVGALAVSALYEPQTYWASMDIRFRLSESYGADAINYSDKDGGSFWAIARIPYVALIDLLCIVVKIDVTHFNWAFAVFYGVAACIVLTFIAAGSNARYLTDPLKFEP